MPSLVQSIPLTGTWPHWLAFGGEFPGEEIVPRLYTVHILLVPGILLALIAVQRARQTCQRWPSTTGSPGEIVIDLEGVKAPGLPMIGMEYDHPSPAKAKQLVQSLVRNSRATTVSSAEPQRPASDRECDVGRTREPGGPGRPLWMERCWRSIV
jgi:hypothetical protein